MGDLSRDGRYAAWSDEDGIYLWDQTSGLTRTLAEQLSNVDLEANTRVTISPDNRFVYFISGHPYISADTNGAPDLYRVNIGTGAVQRVYSNTSFEPTLSANGRYVVVGDFLEKPPLRLDLRTGETAEIGPGNLSTLDVSLSGNGRYAVFTSFNDLIPSDTNGTRDVYLRDFETGELRVISTSSTGRVGNNDSQSGVISEDGSRVAFVTDASNISRFASEGTAVLVSKHLATGIVTFLSKIGERGDGFADLNLSSDGLAVSFVSFLDLAPSDTDGLRDGFVVELIPPEIWIRPISGHFINAAEAGATTTVSGTSDAIRGQVVVTAPDGTQAFSSVDRDGRWSVAFDDLSGVRDGTRTFTPRWWMKQPSSGLPRGMLCSTRLRQRCRTLRLLATTSSTRRNKLPRPLRAYRMRWAATCRSPLTASLASQR